MERKKLRGMMSTTEWSNMCAMINANEAAIQRAGETITETEAHTNTEAGSKTEAHTNTEAGMEHRIEAERVRREEAYVISQVYPRDDQTQTAKHSQEATSRNKGRQRQGRPRPHRSSQTTQTHTNTN